MHILHLIRLSHTHVSMHMCVHTHSVFLQLLQASLMTTLMALFINTVMNFITF
jgi:hypothetical protein